MTTETVNILAIILGAIAVIEPFILSYITNKLIQKEDERAKRMIEEGKRETQKLIEEGNKRLEKILAEIHRSTKEILSEIFKKV